MLRDPSTKFTITIEVEGGSHKVTVTDDAGNRKEYNAITVMAGHSVNKEIYAFAWGDPVNAAWALGEGMAQSQGREWWDSFISCHCKDMMMRTAPVAKTTTIEEVEGRWAKEDLERLAKEKKETH